MAFTQPHSNRIVVGRKLQRTYGNQLAPYFIKWSRRWNYEGWMLTGIEGAKVWIEDKQAELFILGLKFQAGVRKT